jgi:Flp pilus assembly protein TadG
MKGNMKWQRGQTAVLFTLILTTVFGVAGLVTDFGWAYYRKQTAQAAAQAAALATVKAGMTMGGACGLNNVVCQVETTCPASITVSSTMTSVDKGCLYAQSNGFTTGGKQKVTIETGPVSYNGVFVTYWAVAKVSEQLPSLFSIVTGNSSSTLTARSSVGYIPPTNGGCIYVTAPTGSSMTTNGNTQITTGCGIWVNSSDPAAINLNGGNTTITDNNPDSKVEIVGNYSCYGGSTGCISLPPITGVRSAGDPLASIPPPTPSATCDPLPNIGKGTNYINPGTYCGSISAQSNDTIVMNPGNYIFKSGGSSSCGFSVSGNGNVSASGVMLYFQDSCSVSITGNGNVDMSAPTSGMYQGVLMFQARDNATPSSLTGGSGQILNGILYFPDALLHYAGGSSSSINAAAATIITYNLQLNGSSYIWNSGNSPYLNTFSGYAIIE